MAAGQAAELDQRWGEKSGGGRSCGLSNMSPGAPAFLPRWPSVARASPITMMTGTMSLRADTGPKSTKLQRVCLGPSQTCQGHLHLYR